MSWRHSPPSWCFPALLPAEDAAAAKDGWKLCNKTSYIIRRRWASRKETGITVEELAEAAAGDLHDGRHGAAGAEIPLLLYARTSSAHRGGRRSRAGARSCASIRQAASRSRTRRNAAMGLEAGGSARSRSPARCAGRQFQRDRVQSRRGRSAGLQRLLEEAGVTTGAIDGNLGHRTRVAIGEFLKSNGLPETTSDADLIDFTEQVAKERGRTVGFTLCNRTKNRIWSAIARPGAGPEGWKAAAGGC
ncbi:MAG: peptidoglycan-binding domain-containing protein [Hyphomonas sp.]